MTIPTSAPLGGNLAAPSGAHLIVRAIQARIPDWPTKVIGDAWIADNPDPDYTGGWVMVDATTRVFVALDEEPYPSRLGPTVSGGNQGSDVRIRLPMVIDRTYVDRAIRVLITAGVIPDDSGMYL